MNLKDKSLSDLLHLHVEVQDELKKRGTTKSANSLTSEMARHLFCTAFHWTRAKGRKGFSATDKNNVRYKIKSRRMNKPEDRRQLENIRDLDKCKFLAAALLDRHYRVLRAAIIPIDVVRKHAAYIDRSKSYRFMLEDEVWEIKGVRDVTDELRAVEEKP